METFSLRRVGIGVFAAVLFVGLGACGRVEETDSSLMGVARINPTIIPTDDEAVGIYSFAMYTAKGFDLFRYARAWEGMQLQGENREVFAQKAMCATNLTEVLEEVFGRKYNAQGVYEQMRRVGTPDVVINGGSREGIAAKLNTLHNSYGDSNILENGRGLIPVGTIISGCDIAKKCVGFKGDEHIGMIGHAELRPSTSLGTVDVIYFVYHNNWLREGINRSRDLGHGLGKLGDYALPANYKELGYERQWQETPWLRVSYNSKGEALQATRLLPELDDLDPGNSKYNIHLIVPTELKKEIAAGQYKTILTADLFKNEASLTALADTYLKRSTAMSSALSSNDKCLVRKGTRLVSKRVSSAAAGHLSISLESNASCEGFVGDMFAFGQHFAFAVR